MWEVYEAVSSSLGIVKPMINKRKRKLFIWAAMRTEAVVKRKMESYYSMGQEQEGLQFAMK